MQLYTTVELEQLQNHDDRASFREIVEWVENFLGKAHPDLGRTGPVCPFVPRALKLKTVRLAVIHSRHQGPHYIEESVKHFRDAFLQLEPQTGELAFYKAILLIFPDISAEEAPTLIDAVQKKLKPFFVEEGLMLGEFHQRSESPGLHNPNFRPLRSPIPMLAIRFMATSDLPFLDRLTDEPHLRIRYLEAYLKRMGTVIKDEKTLDDARKALTRAKSQLQETTLKPTLAAEQTSRCPFAPLMRGYGQMLHKIRRIVCC